MTITKPPTESSPMIPTSLLVETTDASSSATADTHSNLPSDLRRRRSYPFYKTCPGCDQPFAVMDCDQFHKKQTCSKACAAAVSSRKRKGIKTGPHKKPRKKMDQADRKGNTLTCPACGAAFWQPAAWTRKSAQQFCSRECRARTVTTPNLIANRYDRTGQKFPGTGLKGDKNPAWKGGVTYFKKHGNYTGVKYVRCPAEYLPMARKDGYIMEHRLIVAQAIGRLLLRSEVVHHIDHNPANNDLSNLQLFASNRDHKLYEHHGSPPPLWPQ